MQIVYVFLLLNYDKNFRSESATFVPSFIVNYYWGKRIFAMWHKFSFFRVADIKTPKFKAVFKIFFSQFVLTINCENLNFITYLFSYFLQYLKWAVKVYNHKNSIFILVIPYINDSTSVEAQNLGPFNKTGISSGPEWRYVLFIGKRRDCTLRLEWGTMW